MVHPGSAAVPAGPADQRADREVYGRVYSGDWAEFAAKSDAWHAAKRRSRAAC